MQEIKRQILEAEKLLRDFRSKIPEPPIPMTSDYVFGKDIISTSNKERHGLDNWYVHFTISPPFYEDYSDVKLRLNRILLDDIKLFEQWKIEDAQTKYPNQSLIMHQLCNWEWLVGDDGTILKPITSRDGKVVTYKATIVKYAKILPEFEV